MSENTDQVELNAGFWDQRYQNNLTGWDLGAVSPPLSDYFDQLPDKNISILIPGCGNAYEAAYLLEKGFTNITLIDIAPSLVKGLLEKHQAHIGKQLTLIAGDFFKHSGQYDLVVEQTFFCALDPSLRNAYAAHMQKLVKPGGKLAGLLFDKSFEGGPPFGGSKSEYQSLFERYFHIEKMEPCTNSVKPRMGSEVFIELIPKPIES
jgi:methyl halide transferase